MKRLVFLLFCLTSLALALAFFALIYVAVFAPAPHIFNSQEITSKVDAMYEVAAIQVPHGKADKDAMGAHFPLFESVESGEELNVEASKAYRELYQELLKKNQKAFGYFDKQLTVIADFSMHEKNNTGGMGIEGLHDHHDVSARNNLDKLLAHRSLLQQHPHSAGFSFQRIILALQCYKNLTDILLHLATVPQTKSVHYEAHYSADPFAQEFESMLREFKSAQFEKVNSAQYRVHISQALTHYDKLILMMQEHIVYSLSPLERKYVGEWGGWQSLTPQVEISKSLRIDRKANFEFE